MNEFFRYLIPIIGGSIVLIIVGIYIGLEIATKAKVLLGDFFRFLGFLSKNIRRKSVSSELEGTLNGVINDFNKNFSQPILANCKVEWVTAENQSNKLVEGQAIICLSFDQKDHDLNFFNATYNFIQTALLTKAKPFIKQTTKRAIDLLSTKLILKEYRREVLTKFNNKFSEVEPEVKETYYKLDETEQNGLFNNLLIPEFYYAGEVLFDKTPTLQIEQEIEQFINWFYDLATRELDEHSVLKFETSNFKIGVILIAKLSTYEKYGTQAYINRAEKYASDHFNAVYLLAKGMRRNNIAEEIADILTHTKGFNQVNKKTLTKRMGEDGNPVVITCICLRPDPTSIIYNAWQFLLKKFKENEKVVGIVETTALNYIMVNVSGLKVRIKNEDLSEMKIPDASKLFKEDQELELIIKECNIEIEAIWLSNAGTTTDPKIFIEGNLSEEKPIKANVIKVRRDKDNLDKGIVVKCAEPAITVFIPRSKCTFSRFVDISQKYVADEKVDIILEQFNFSYGNYIGRICGINDPWQSSTVDRLHVGAEIQVVIKEIQEKYISCEIQEGLECRLYQNEVSWISSECTTEHFKIDQSLNVRIMRVDILNRTISVSLKQLSSSPTKQFFSNNTNKIFSGTIISIDNTKGINFKTENQHLKGFIHWTEIIWGNLYPLDSNLSIGEAIAFKPIDYVTSYDTIKFSSKRCLPHQFDDFNKIFDIQNFVKGEVIKVYTQIATIKIYYQGIIVQGYIHKSEVSNCCFVNNENLPLYIQQGKIYRFIVKSINKEFLTIELSRKPYLSEVKNKTRLGVAYKVHVTKIEKGKTFFYSDDIEGFIFKELTRFAIGEEMEVIAISTFSNEFELAE